MPSSDRRKLFGLVEEESYERSRALIEPDVKRADELLTGITWQVARSPFLCAEQLGTPFRRAVAAVPDSDSLLVVFFTVDEPAATVHLWWVGQFTVEANDV